MWTEVKGRRFEELRKRTTALTESERAELQEMTAELEGVESGFMDENTNRKRLAIERKKSAKPVSLWIIGKSAIIGMLLAMFGGAAWVYHDFDAEPAPILSLFMVMVMAAIFFAPYGLTIGTVVGFFLLAAKHAPDRDGVNR